MKRKSKIDIHYRQLSDPTDPLDRNQPHRIIIIFEPSENMPRPEALLKRIKDFMSELLE